MSKKKNQIMLSASTVLFIKSWLQKQHKEI